MAIDWDAFIDELRKAGRTRAGNMPKPAYWIPPPGLTFTPPVLPEEPAFRYCSHKCGGTGCSHHYNHNASDAECPTLCPMCHKRKAGAR